MHSIPPTLVVPALLAFSALAAAQEDRFEKQIVVAPDINEPLTDALSASGDFLAIGADSDAFGTDSGIIHRYKRIERSGEFVWVHANPYAPYEVTERAWLGFAIDATPEAMALSLPWWKDLGEEAAGQIWIYRPQGDSWQLANRVARGGDLFGYRVALSGGRLLGATRAASLESGTVHAYAFNGANWVEDGDLVPSQGGSSAGFGVSIALDGDIAVVGAPDFDAASSARFSGGAFVFERIGNQWVETAIFTEPQPWSGADFGFDVAVHGDRIAVGAPGFHEGDQAGRVLTWRRIGGNWVPDQTYFGADPGKYQQFGAAVDVHGEDLLVAARLEENPGGLGVAYHISPAHRTRLVPTSSVSTHRFGFAVDIGPNRLLITASNYSPAAEAAWVFAPDGAGGWRQIDEILPDGISGSFGYAAAFAGSDLVVGAPFTYHPDRRGGTAAVHRQRPGGYARTQVLAPEPELVGDRFGAAVHMAGAHTVAGAPGDDQVAPDAGSAYVFRKANNVGKIAPPDLAPGDSFGSAVAYAEDPDGPDRIAVAASGDDSFGVDAGAVHVFEGGRSSWVRMQKLVPNGPNPAPEFGASVALLGEVLVVGAPGSTGLAGAQQGASFVYRLESGAWNLEAVLRAGSAGAGDRFGTAVALAGDRVLVGSPGSDLAAVDAGAVHLFRRAPGGWVEAPVVLAPDAAAGSAFGAAVAVENRRVLVGAPAARSGEGCAYVFADCGLAVPKLRLLSSIQSSDHGLGSAVAVATGTTLVTMPGYARSSRHGAVLAYDTDAGDLSGPDFVADTDSLDVATGGRVTLGLCPGAALEDQWFFILGSLSGDSPGFDYDGFHIPLNPDAYFQLTVSLPDRLFLAPSIGTLALDGRASAALVVPPLPGFAGLEFTHAYAVFDPASGQLLHVSEPLVTSLH